MCIADDFLIETSPIMTFLIERFTSGNSCFLIERIFLDDFSYRKVHINFIVDDFSDRKFFDNHFLIESLISDNSFFKKFFVDEMLTITFLIKTPPIMTFSIACLISDNTFLEHVYVYGFSYRKVHIHFIFKQKVFQS